MVRKRSGEVSSMAAKTAKAGQPSIRKLWGIAKCPELKLTDEEVHLVVAGHTGKDSIRDLNKRELQMVIRVLYSMKESARKSKHRQKTCAGNPATENQRKKIYRLAEELGWDKPSRLSGMCQRMFKVSAVEWLDYKQCSKLIEALKKMAERQKDKEAQDAGLQADSDGCG